VSASAFLDGAEVRSLGVPAVAVVLVDDRPEIRCLVRAHLDRTGVAVLGEASDGWEAVKLVERVAPDVVVMDVQMPGMDGVHATRELTARHPEVAVVGFSGADDPSAREAMREAGAVQQFCKGDLRELVAYLAGDVLARAIGERRRHHRPAIWLQADDGTG
jgi:DNA-binding NarL/FixJ family response regulator